MYEVLFTDRTRLAAAEAAVLDQSGIPDGMPFLVASESLEYPAEINAFLRRLPSTGAPSPLTWKAHAYTIATWSRFLSDQRGKSDVWSATQEDAEVYYRARRIMDPSQGLSAASWNRHANHLTNLYDHGVRTGLCAENPFRSYQRLSVNGVEVDRSETAVRESHSELDSMRYHSREEYQQLREVGFKGMLPGGQPDPNYTPREVTRNVAFVELLATSGMRVGEASALCRHELLAAGGDAFQKMLLLPLPAAITKNQKARRVLLALRVQRLVSSYVETTRAIEVARANEAGTYTGPGWVEVRSWDAVGYTPAGGRRVAWSKATPATRRRLVEVRADGSRDPFNVWLSSTGKPLSVEAWTPAFATAEARCRVHGIELSSSPHKLRHTFAVHMLNFLERQRVGDLEVPGVERYTGNSLRTLQLLLGHASLETTTQFYLPALDMMTDVLDEVSGAYSEYLAGEQP